jgi:tetratricopeptide (TPR) repeat protein
VAGQNRWWLGGGLVVALGLGWLLSAVIHDHQATASPSRLEVDRQVKELLEKRTKQPLSPADERRLMERLLALGRLPESIVLVEEQVKANPKLWRWRLLLAQLHLRNENSSAAEAQIQSLKRLHPHQVDVLQTLAQLRLEQGRTKDAIAEVQTSLNAAPADQRVMVGLLLADLQRQSGQPAAALSTYTQLNTQAPLDARPVMAKALLLKEQGQQQEAKQLLTIARQRQISANQDPQAIDALAARWGLSTSRTAKTETKPPVTAPSQETELSSERPTP